MIGKNEQNTGATAKNRGDVYCDTPTNNTEQMTRADRAEDVNRSPNFLDTINDFSDLVAFQVKCDQIAHGEEPTGKEMSQNKCRFCS